MNVECKESREVVAHGPPRLASVPPSVGIDRHSGWLGKIERVKP